MRFVASRGHTEPFRIIVWGPGGLGSLCIREVTSNPAFTLVGVRVYSDSKHGVDAGTLAGIASVGVRASAQPAELLQVPCDCILYTARDYGNYQSDAEILQLLEAGRTVVTSLPYQYLDLARPFEFAERVRSVCERTGGRFHATGVNPCLIPDRVLLALSGLCNEVRSAKSEEYWDVSNLHPETLKLCGFGVPAETARQNSPIAELADNFLKLGLMSWAEAVGVVYDRVEVESDHAVADQPVALRGGVIDKGMVGRIMRRWCGYVEAIGAAPFMTVEMNWVIGKHLRPAKFRGASGYHGWKLTIEGRPSIGAFVDVTSSPRSDPASALPNQEESEAGYLAVVATLLQAVAEICRAPRGILPAQRTPVHWRKDPRCP